MGNSALSKVPLTGVILGGVCFCFQGAFFSLPSLPSPPSPPSLSPFSLRPFLPPSSQAGTSGDKRLQTKLEQTDAAVVGTPQRGLQASGDGSPDPGCVVGPDHNSVYISSAPLFYLPSFTLWPNSSSRELVFVCLSSLPVFCNPASSRPFGQVSSCMCLWPCQWGPPYELSKKQRNVCAYLHTCSWIPCAAYLSSLGSGRGL